MKQNWDTLDNDRRRILSEYLNEMQPNDAVDRIRFTKRECSCCGEIGFVPEHHRFLCVFCWVTAHYFDEPHQDYYERQRSTTSETNHGKDKVMSNIPIGIEGVGVEPEVYKTTVYSADDYTQEELQAMVS